MPYEIGQKAILILPNKEQEIVEIFKRAIDYKNGFVDEGFAVGGGDYLVLIEGSSVPEQIFCFESDLIVLV
jgi:hypothetical protein